MRHLALCLSTLMMIVPTAALALPRDAEAVLNHCGTPLHGDETIYEDTVAGGRRILHYGRGTLYFDRMANNGWTFTYGQRSGQGHLSLDQMSVYMPCLQDALIESASSSPLVRVTAVDRATASIKRSLQEVILASLLFLVVLGFVFLLWSRRPTNDEGLVG